MKPPAFPALAVIALLTLLVYCSPSRGDIPSPAETPAVVIVSGHTSTAVSIQVVNIGQQIPKTYAGALIHNMPGFTFYVSQHYALQSDKGDAYSAGVLEVAELAYPHWVDLIGAEPPDPATRMYIVYASTAELMKKAIANDTGLGEPNSYGGGITLYANHSAYNYPSGTLQYHQRALVIHENLHLLQMVVFGTGGLEDFTYSGEQSVYDPAKKQLTVMVFDKATINNWTDVGLTRYQAEGPSFSGLLAQAWNSGGGPGVTLTQFFWTDPDRFLKWKIWRDEFYQGHINSTSVAPVTASIFGPLALLDGPLQTWLKTRHNSFHYVDWGWEQEGNTLWSYGFPQHGAFAQTDLRYKPGEPAVYDPYRMDYPTQPPSPLVGPVQRGGATPRIGATIDFSRNHDNGVAGLGLGMIGSAGYAIMIQEERTASVFSQDITDAPLALARQDFALPADVIEGARRNGHVFGLTVTIGADALLLTVRTGVAPRIKTVTFSAPISPAQRQRMLGEHMAVLAKSNYHGITPYIDDARQPSPDLSRPAPANFWRYAGLDELETLYKAAWRLGDKTPASLLTLKAEMLASVTGSAAERAASISHYNARILGILHDIQKSPGDRQQRALAIADLTGLFLVNKVDRPAQSGDPLTLVSTVINRLSTPIECRIDFSAEATTAPRPTPQILKQYRPFMQNARYPASGTKAILIYRLKWRGETITFPVTVALSYGSAVP